jgi:CMP-N,N'-diacetyllegionaminic acid synthase
MNKPPTICAIIPAKNISKRIPGKNLKMLAGKPMMAYIIETAKRAKGVDRVIVSTESEEIKKIAELYGAEVPFIRPIELINDDTTTQEVILHAIDWLKEHEDYMPDYVLVIYPTSPLLKAERIEEAIALALARGSDLVFSGCYDKGHYWVGTESGDYERLYPTTHKNSQYQVPLVVENGAICLAKTECYRRPGLADRADPLIMEKGENIDVDYPEDFARVEEILSRHGS